jgi:hypothetical protein
VPDGERLAQPPGMPASAEALRILERATAQLLFDSASTNMQLGGCLI